MKIKDNFKTALFCAVFPFFLGLMLKRIYGAAPEWHEIFSLIMYACAVLSLIIPKFGIFIHKQAAKAGSFAGNIAAKIVLFFVWIFTILPLGLLMKLTGRDRLRLKRKDTASYWIDNKTQNTDYEYQF